MKFLSKLIIICLFVIATSSAIFSKNMDVEHLHNTCYIEAAIHALSKVDEINDKLRNCKTLTPGSIPRLYIKLVDKIKDNWGKPKNVFIGSDEIEPGFTLEDFYKKLANEFDTEPDEKGKPTSVYGSFKDSRNGAIDPIIKEINAICPSATNDLSFKFVRQRTDKSGTVTYNLTNVESFSYSLPLFCIYNIQSGFEYNFQGNPFFFRKIPKILILNFNMQPQDKSLADTITLKKEFIAPDIEFHRQDGSAAKLDPETKKLKDLNCDLTYELFVIGTAQPDFHWWVYAKDSGSNGQWYKYDNFRDTDGKVKHFSNLKEIESDFEVNHYPMYFFYRLKPTLTQQLTQLKTSLQELKTKLTTLHDKLDALRKNLG